MKGIDFQTEKTHQISHIQSLKKKNSHQGRYPHKILEHAKYFHKKKKGQILGIRVVSVFSVVT
jgi:hypothetical protein